MASAAGHRELDRAAIEDWGVPPALLMENASRACADRAEALLGSNGDLGRVLVLAGPGNNGGDGFAIARTLHNRGQEVDLIRVGRPEDFDRSSPEARHMARLWGRIVGSPGANEPRAELEAKLVPGVLLVDAVFGTGLARPVTGVHAEVLEAAARGAPRCLAIDLPSGLDADRGTLLGPVVPALETVTFGAWKPGLLEGEGPRVAGRVTVAEIGLPRSLVESLAPRP